MARRRKPGARTKSGRLSRAYQGPARDAGTLEGVRNRAYLVNGAPVELAGSPLGILLANGHIELRHVRAAGRYAALRATLFGLARPTVSADLVEPYGAPDRTDGALLRIRDGYEGMCRRISRDQKLVIDLIVVDGALPHWFRQAKLGRPLRPVDELERAALLSGLAALARR